jgi:hypothetical protein
MGGGVGGGWRLKKVGGKIERELGEGGGDRDDIARNS